MGLLTPFLELDAAEIKASFLGKVVTNVQFATMIAMLVPHVPATQLLMWLLGGVSVLAIADYIVFIGRELTTRSIFESSKSVAGVYFGTSVAFGLIVWVLLRDEFRNTIELLL